MLTLEVKTLTEPEGKFPDMETPDLAAIARAARIRLNLTPQQAADLIGCSRPLVLAWEKGDNTLKGSKYLLPAARAYKVRPQWLSTGTGEDGFPWTDLMQGPLVSEMLSQPVARFETEDGYVRFPLLEGFAGMGRGDYIGDYPEVVESLRVSREWVERKLPGVPPEAIRVITGRGDSMKGQYNDGDLIFLDTRIKTFDQDSAYCFRWEGRVLIKRLQFVGRNTLRILSKNPDYPSIDAPMDDIEIGGRALAAWTLKEF
jgi:phage repressor protein C with HTH and peptisase S24 domain